MDFKPGCYLAFELSPTTRGELLKRYPPKFSKVICHHVTIEFNLTEQKLAKILADLSIRDPKVEVVGYLSDDSIECLTVAVNGKMTRPDGKHYHVTLSLEPPRAAKHSNDLIDKTDERHQAGHGLVLKGQLKLLKK